jgi:TolB-like protein/tRNA A-37 threonylcarbamoyl transferase component Bud32/Tfp pilus assembly protein PilF
LFVFLMALQAKDRLGPYEIVALLGVGGMGEVYRGRDTRLGRDVALKVISPKRLGDDELRRRFELEARAASVLNHPSIVTIYDVGDADGVAWIAMEWVEGRTLRQALLDADGPLPLPDALTIARQIAEGLAAAHAKGIVHRDLKPENVMLALDGRSKILDFGLARQSVVESLEGAGSGVETLAGFPNAQTFEGTVLGTVGYMSPEQASGRPVDSRSDQFALGLIAYEMVTGRRAFSRPTAVETLAALIREEPVPLVSLRTDVPQALQALIARCLAKRPEDRFASTRELAAALESLGQGLASGSFAATEIAVVPLPQPLPTVAPRRFPRRAAYVLGAVVALALAAAVWMRFHAPKSAIDSLAVLPFANASKDPEAAYLSDGITESLINQMSRLPSLKVMARATVFRFKDATDPQEAGRKLGVGAVLTGNVSRRGDRLLISAELMEIGTGARLWGEKYDRPFADLLRVQDSIASEISDALRLRLSTQQKSTLGGHGTENPQAYELSLKARFFLMKDTEEGDLEARRLYLQAVEKDPKFADARVGAATTYNRSAVGGYARPAEAWPRAEEEVRKALDLDPSNLLARCVLAHRHFFYDWDWTRTEREYRELANDSRLFLGELWRPIGLFHWARGRTDEAVALMEKALQIDPGDLVSKIMMGNFLAQAGRLDDAIGYYKAVAEAEPSDPRPLFGLAEVLKRRGDVKGAIEARRKAYERSGEEDGATALATAKTEKDYENAEIAVARFRLGELEAVSKERYVSPLDLARLQAQVGEREKAFASLEAAFAERSAGLVFLKVERAWDRIRDDPRFASVVRRIGIP